MRWRLRLPVSLGLALLESSQPGALGRHSYLTADPFLRVESVGGRITLQWRDRSPQSEVRYGQPFAVLRKLLAEYAMPLARTGGSAISRWRSRRICL